MDDHGPNPGKKRQTMPSGLWRDLGSSSCWDIFFMKEAGVLIALSGDPIFWHLPPGRTSVLLPDSQDLWDRIWEHRDILQGFAHTHPGSGIPEPSSEDLTTFAAVESGLGRRLRWWISSSNKTVVLEWKGPGKWDYAGEVVEDPRWVTTLRTHSQGDVP